MQAIAEEYHIKTYSEKYEGVKLLEIFQRPDYIDGLHEFLAKKNKVLLAISLARERKGTNELIYAREEFEKIVEKAKILDT